MVMVGKSAGRAVDDHLWYGLCDDVIDVVCMAMCKGLFFCIFLKSCALENIEKCGVEWLFCTNYVESAFFIQSAAVAT